eukprot:352098-Chlamydomonas_euryale.AAC.2
MGSTPSKAKPRRGPSPGPGPRCPPPHMPKAASLPLKSAPRSANFRTSPPAASAAPHPSCAWWRAGFGAGAVSGWPAPRALPDRSRRSCSKAATQRRDSSLGAPSPQACVCALPARPPHPAALSRKTRLGWQYQPSNKATETHLVLQPSEALHEQPVSRGRGAGPRRGLLQRDTCTSRRGRRARASKRPAAPRGAAARGGPSMAPSSPPRIVNDKGIRHAWPARHSALQAMQAALAVTDEDIMSCRPRNPCKLPQRWRPGALASWHMLRRHGASCGTRHGGCCGACCRTCCGACRGWVVRATALAVAHAVAGLVLQLKD